MKGLEVTVLSLSEIVDGNRDKRLDSQYFRRAALAAEKLIAAHMPDPISKISEDVRSFGAYALTNEFEYQDEGIPFLRGTDYSGDFIKFSNTLRISEDAHRLLHKSEVAPGMVLLSMSGSVGSVAVALDDWDYPINSNQDIAKIIPKGVSPYYLAAYLGGRFGKVQIDRLPVGSVQQHVFLWMIQRLQVPRFSQNFEESVGRLAASAYRQHEGVGRDLVTAEGRLLAALGLADWTPPEPLTYTARASDTFAAGRLDAQYFRPLFAEIAERLRLTGHGVELGSILTTNARGRQPQYADAGLPVVNSKHVRTNRVLLDDNRTATEEGSTVIIGNGDVLVNGTGVGTIGRAAAYLHSERALPDNHVTVLRTANLDPVYLAVFLNSPLGQWQIERHIKGSSGQIELYPNDIAKVVVWQAPDDIQSAVRQAVMDAFAQERRAKELLDAAKRAVEIAIEDSEAVAMAYLIQAGEAA